MERKEHLVWNTENALLGMHVMSFLEYREYPAWNTGKVLLKRKGAAQPDAVVFPQTGCAVRGSYQMLR